MDNNWHIIIWISREVLIFCVVFQEFFHVARDLSQAKKKITVVAGQASDNMTTIFTQNDNFDHLEWFWCHLVYLVNLDKSHVKWDDSQNITQKIRTSVRYEY